MIDRSAKLNPTPTKVPAKQSKIVSARTTPTMYLFGVPSDFNTPTSYVRPMVARYMHRKVPRNPAITATLVKTCSEEEARAATRITNVTSRATAMTVISVRSGRCSKLWGVK